MNFFEPILKDAAFFIFSFFVLLGALGVILEVNIVRAGFSLVICFGAVAGIYFALHAPFVGVSQVLIYTVGITLVIVFALMLTSAKQTITVTKSTMIRNLVSMIVSFGIFLTLAKALTGNKWQLKEVFVCQRNTEILGFKLLGDYILPFELISVLLLVALVGAVVIAKKDKAGEEKR